MMPKQTLISQFSRNLYTDLKTVYPEIDLSRRKHMIFQNVEDVVFGILLERTIDKLSIYLWRVIFPLTSISFNLALTYSNKIQESPLNIGLLGDLGSVHDIIIRYDETPPVFKGVTAIQFLEFLVNYKKKVSNKSPEQDLDIALHLALVGETDEARHKLLKQLNVIDWHENVCIQRLSQFKDRYLLEQLQMRLSQIRILKSFLSGHENFDNYLIAAREANAKLLGLPQGFFIPGRLSSS